MSVFRAEAAAPGRSRRLFRLAARHDSFASLKDRVSQQVDAVDLRLTQPRGGAVRPRPVLQRSHLPVELGYAMLGRNRPRLCPLVINTRSSY